MDSFSQTPLLFLTFFQQRPCLNSELQKEVENLCYEVKLSTAPSGLNDRIAYTQDHVLDSDIECDGELQTDGQSFHRDLLQDISPSDLGLPVLDEDTQVAREVAAELIRMADEFNHVVVSHAAEHLTRTLSSSSKKYWWTCLSQVVDSLLKDVPDVNSERMVMALSFSLVRAVCERAPRLFRGLYQSMTQHHFTTRPR